MSILSTSATNGALLISTSSLNIHPSGDNSKCVGILGGTYADGTAVDIYDCNGSITQKWQWNGNALDISQPVDGSNGVLTR
ncbi:hypothetical protein CPB84DRAFT_1681953 [Gymnopilus junonius]|uniref:Ricin B lectin domain-containing protein n=1 Tax=Gymnopilus junonius TaxID=109634 RepID=A0A9P5NIY7_GYMJU|nr:hypothetical protein CPB84DRAFT_1681953 [Gymnopilus junonius]